MKFLAIDTSNYPLTVIVDNEGEREVVFNKECGVSHSKEIMPAIEGCLLKSNLSLKDLDFIAVVIGAGSFTGIRIGVATAKALCFANSLPILPITSFDTIAYNVTDKSLALINAKHGCFYACGYDNGKVSFPPSFIDSNTLLSLSNDYSLLSFEDIDGVNLKVVCPKEGLIKAVYAKKNDVTCDLESVVPLYVRKSQAEEGR